MLQKIREKTFKLNANNKTKKKQKREIIDQLTFRKLTIIRSHVLISADWNNSRLLSYLDHDANEYFFHTSTMSNYSPEYSPTTSGKQRVYGNYAAAITEPNSCSFTSQFIHISSEVKSKLSFELHIKT